jgi:hypothetical protein
VERRGRRAAREENKEGRERESAAATASTVGARQSAAGGGAKERLCFGRRVSAVEAVGCRGVCRRSRAARVIEAV